MKIIFFGTPDFAAKVLNDLIKNQFEILAVVTKPDRPKGRSGIPVPTPVKEIALAQSSPITVFQPELASDPEFAAQLALLKADLFVVVAYGEIIKQYLLDMPRLGCINLHASLLPKYRGAAPIQRALINGELESGVTIMFMAKKMDAGDIIEVVKVPISNEMTYGELDASLYKNGSVCLIKVLNDFKKGIIHRYPQDHEQATFAPKIELEDCELKWSEPAQKLHNLVRGVNPHPGAWTFVWLKEQKKRLKIMRTQVLTDKSGSPGEILSFGKEGFVIACGKDALQILELQLEGKRLMTANEFVQGFSLDHISF